MALFICPSDRSKHPGFSVYPVATDVGDQCLILHVPSVVDLGLIVRPRQNNGNQPVCWCTSDLETFHPNRSVAFDNAWIMHDHVSISPVQTIFVIIHWFGHGIRIGVNDLVTLCSSILHEYYPGCFNPNRGGGRVDGWEVRKTKYEKSPKSPERE